VFAVDPLLQLQGAGALPGLGPRLRHAVRALGDPVVLRPPRRDPTQLQTQPDQPQGQRRRQVTPGTPGRAVVPLDQPRPPPAAPGGAELVGHRGHGDLVEVALGEKPWSAARRRRPRRQAAATTPAARWPAAVARRHRPARRHGPGGCAGPWPAVPAGAARRGAAPRSVAASAAWARAGRGGGPPTRRASVPPPTGAARRAVAAPAGTTR